MPETSNPPEREVWSGTPFRHAWLSGPAKLVAAGFLLSLAGPVFFMILFLGRFVVPPILGLPLEATLAVGGISLVALAFRRRPPPYRVTTLAASLRDKRGRILDSIPLANIESVTVSGMEQRSTSNTLSNSRLNKVVTPTSGQGLEIGDIKIWQGGAPRLVFLRVHDPNGIADEIRLAIQHAKSLVRTAKPAADPTPLREEDFSALGSF
jgi:hypothetical protein